MAGPISHTIYAEKALKNLTPQKNERAFIVGTLFPDIRYLKVIDRETSHIEGITLGKVRSEVNSFKAGMLFHALIDKAREKFVLEHNAYDNLPDSHLSTIALKICEDIKLYPKSHNWKTYAGYLEGIEPEEKAFGIPREKIELWHTMHREFLVTPNFSDNKDFFYRLGFNDDQVAEIFRLVTVISENRIVEHYLDEFYDNLMTILEEYS